MSVMPRGVQGTPGWLGLTCSPLAPTSRPCLCCGLERSWASGQHCVCSAGLAGESTGGILWEQTTHPGWSCKEAGSFPTQILDAQDVSQACYSSFSIAVCVTVLRATRCVSPASPLHTPHSPWGLSLTVRIALR